MFQRGLPIFACVALLAFLTWPNGRFSRAQSKPAQPERAMMDSPPLEVGKKYYFWMMNSNIRSGKVLEEPRGKWVLTEYQQDGTRYAWVNLDNVKMISFDKET